MTMNVDAMTETLNKYLIHCNINSIAIETKGVGVDRKGVMEIPANTFKVHPLAEELHLIGYTPASEQSNVPEYARYDDSRPSSVKLLTKSGQTIESKRVNDSIDMFNTLVILIPPIKAHDPSATGLNIDNVLLEILQLLKDIKSRV